MALLTSVRQALVALSPQLAAISVGGSVTYPTLLLQQLKSNSSSIPPDIAIVSWIGSIYGLAGIVAILMPILMEWRGRKQALITTCSLVVIGWILSYFAKTTPTILISECFHGIGTGSLLPVTLLSITEMLAPNYRFLSMQLFGINQGVGMAIGGIAGQFLSISTVSIIMIIPVAIAIVLALIIWPESPQWLACKGKFDECEKAFVWLRGTDDLAKKELEEFIVARKEDLSERRFDKGMSLKRFWSQITSKDFYVPSLHIYLLLNLLYWSGGDVVMIYFIELVSKSTSNENATFYSGIILYSIIFAGCLITNVTLRYFKNKTVLLASAFGVTLSLISICIVSFLQIVDIVPGDSLLFMYCLIAYVVCNSLGMNGVVFFIGGELMPVKHRNIGGSMFIIFNCSFFASTQKISPYMVHYMGMWGTFMVFTLNIIISSYLVWKYIPETKGRTLNEIENYYMYGQFIPRNIDGDVIENVMKINSI